MPLITFYFHTIGFAFTLSHAHTGIERGYIGFAFFKLTVRTFKLKHRNNESILRCFIAVATIVLVCFLCALDYRSGVEVSRNII